MTPRITIEVRKGVATVRTRKLRLPEIHELKGKSLIEVVVRDYDIEGGSQDKDVIRRGYFREISEVTLEY
jgi:hypothetical protein